MRSGRNGSRGAHLALNVVVVYFNERRLSSSWSPDRKHQALFNAIVSSTEANAAFGFGAS